jgi:general secretion pathway protein K
LSEHSRNQRAAGEQGFTFLVVIWALSILIVLALVFGASISAHLKTTRNAIDNARAEALADAGVELVVLDLSGWRARAVREARFPRDGRPVRCSLGNGDWLSIAVEDEVGKVDLNTANERLVGAALLAAGVAEDDVARHARRILDYRDADSSRRPLGAESEEYRDQGRAGPKNKPFDAVEEVEQVLGVPAGLADALRPYATIYSGQVTVDGNIAHRRLLAALSNRGFGNETDDAGNLLGDVPRAAPTSNLLSGAGGGRAFRVLAEARTPQGAVFVREAVLEFVATRPGAYAFRRWRKGLATTTRDGTVEKSPSNSDLPPC